MMVNQEIVSFLSAAIECSIYLAPNEPGLAYDELIEVASRVGYQRGQVEDALRYRQDTIECRGGRTILSSHRMVFTIIFTTRKSRTIGHSKD